MNKYLQRIKFTDPVAVDDKTLATLHEQHVFQVPFENLDIYYKNVFDLKPANIYQKVVRLGRGGFCYELNSLFHTLLRDLGFHSRMIAARIFDDGGKLGPAYDHLALHVEINNHSYLVDVGFGDLFLRPIKIKPGIYDDGRNFFMIERLSDQDFVLAMAPDRTNFQKKYQFNLRAVAIDKFHDICLDKQTSPTSYFVKNLVCTKPTHTGRLTLFNDKLIEKKGQERMETQIGNESELSSALKNKFGVVMQ